MKDFSAQKQNDNYARAKMKRKKQTNKQKQNQPTWFTFMLENSFICHIVYTCEEGEGAQNLHVQETNRKFLNVKVIK